MRWVWATLVDTAVGMYRRFVADLCADAAAGYYADQLAIARLLGIPEALLPPTWGAFEGWFAGVLASDELTVDDRAREIADAVLSPPGNTANARLMRLLAAALLPEPLRAAFGLDWGAEKAQRFGSLVESVRGLRGRPGAVDGSSNPR
jgi:uncharacterized protein (DUF2236 family)